MLLCRCTHCGFISAGGLRQCDDVRRLFVSSSPLFPPFFLLVDGAIQFTEAGARFQVLDSVGAEGSDQPCRVHGGHGARQGGQGLGLVSVCRTEVQTLGGVVREAGGEAGGE